MTNHASSPLRRFSLRDQAREEIRARIIAGEITADKIISIGSIAAELEVSVTPVREAVMDLAGVGMVEIARNKGFRATAITEHDLDEIFAIRKMLEVPATVEVARLRPSAEVLSPYFELAHLVVEAAESGEINKFLNYDRRLHLGLIGLLGNERLVKVVGDLRDQARLAGLQNLANQGLLADTASEHVELVELIAQGDVEAVEELMEKHLAHGRGSWAGRGE